MEENILEEIVFTFDKNFERLNNLLQLYETISTGKGRKPTNTIDLLRATVVLTHSTLEDFLRSVMLWRLPNADKDVISTIPLIGTGTKNTFDFGKLLPHKSKTVEEIITLSVREYLNSRSFNNTEQITGSLNSVNISINDEMRQTFRALDEMIKRRHNIVHQADRESKKGKGYHRIKSLSHQTVSSWRDAVDKFVKEVIKNL